MTTETTRAMTPEEFLAALPAYLGLGIRADRSLTREDGTLSVGYRWLGEEIYRVEWDPTDARPWTIMERPRVGSGPWSSIATGHTPEEAAEVLLTFTLRFPANPHQEGLAARLADRIPPARLVVPEGGPDLAAYPALGMTAVILLTHDPVEVPRIRRSPITGAAIVADPIRREGTCVDILPDGKPPERVPVRMREWFCPAIDAPDVVRQLVDAGHRDGVLPLMVVLGPSHRGYSIPIRLTEDTTIVVRSGVAVGLNLPAELRESGPA